LRRTSVDLVLHFTIDNISMGIFIPDNLNLSNYFCTLTKVSCNSLQDSITPGTASTVT
jgi:hypothetical protein